MPSGRIISPIFWPNFFSPSGVSTLDGSRPAAFRIADECFGESLRGRSPGMESARPTQRDPSSEQMNLIIIRYPGNLLAPGCV